MEQEGDAIPSGSRLSNIQRNEIIAFEEYILQSQLLKLAEDRTITQVFTCEVSLPADRESPFKDAIFQVELRQHLDSIKVQVKFLTPIWHPEVQRDTGLMQFHQEATDTDNHFIKAFEHILSALNYPEVDCIENPIAGKEYENNRFLGEFHSRWYTRMYAMPNPEHKKHTFVNLRVPLRNLITESNSILSTVPTLSLYTGDDLREVIQNKFGIPTAWQKISCQRMILDKNVMLVQLQNSIGSPLMLDIDIIQPPFPSSIPRFSRLLRIYLRLPFANVTMRIPSTCTVLLLKQHITSHLGIPQILLCTARKEESLPDNYIIQDGLTILASIQPPFAEPQEWPNPNPLREQAIQLNPPIDKVYSDSVFGLPTLLPDHRVAVHMPNHDWKSIDYTDTTKVSDVKQTLYLPFHDVFLDTKCLRADQVLHTLFEESRCRILHLREAVQPIERPIQPLEMKSSHLRRPDDYNLPDLQPFLEPEGLYDVWPPKDSKKGNLDEFTRVMSFRGDHTVPGDWTRHIHPDGQPYYSCAMIQPLEQMNSEARERQKGKMRDTSAFPTVSSTSHASFGSTPEPTAAERKTTHTIITDDDLTIEGHSEHLKIVASGIIRKYRWAQTETNDNDLYLSFGEVIVDEGRPPVKAFRYYFVDRSQMRVFWVESTGSGHFFKIALEPGESPEQHLFRNYLRHAELFPSHFDCHPNLEPYLRASLVHAAAGHLITPNKERSLLQASDCNALLDMLEGTFENHDRPTNDTTYCDTSGYNTWFAAVVLQRLISPKRMPFHGTPLAASRRSRQDRNSARLGSQNFVFRLLDIFSWFILSTYRERIQHIWSDQVVTLAEWQNFLGSVLADWSESNLLATVLLSTNMGFLTLEAANSTAKSLILISTFLATGSLGVGLYSGAKHRNAQIYYRDDPTYGDNYFQNTHRQSSLLAAFLLGLPLILLVWSVLVFVAAVAMLAFSGGQSLVAVIWSAIILLGVVLFLLMTLVFFRHVFEKRNQIQRVM